MKKDPNKEAEPIVSPPEDLMKEHGLLNRTLLIYEEIIRRFEKKIPFDASIILENAHIIRNFIEDYHEKSEETYLFPRFKETKKYRDLVEILESQHIAGRILTNNIILLEAKNSDLTPKKQKDLALWMHQFIHMYRAHETREDTELFPAMYELFTHAEIRQIAYILEDTEEEKFGAGGFESLLKTVSDLEKELDIHDLAQYTPKLTL